MTQIQLTPISPTLFFLFANVCRVQTTYTTAVSSEAWPINSQTDAKETMKKKQYNYFKC